MKTKVLIPVLILGIIFIGSGVFAIMNGDFVFNNQSSDLDNNFTSIQNQNSLTKDVDSLNNTGLISSGILKSFDYIDYQNKTKKELLFDYVENNGVDEYFYALHIDRTNLTSGYVSCTDCGFFIPIGNVSNLIPEEYLCNCSVYVSSSVIPTFSEENVLNFVYYDINYIPGRTFYDMNKYGFHSYPLTNSLNNQSNITESSVDVVNSSNSNSDTDVPIVEQNRRIPVNPHNFPTAEDIYRFGESHRNQTPKI